MRPNRPRIRGVLLSALFATTVWWAAQPGGLGGTEGGPLTTPRPAAASSGPVVSRTVQPGDTLWSIAERTFPGDPREGVWELRERNDLDSAVIVPGQVLVLPA